jgi:hypothetical protein
VWSFILTATCLHLELQLTSVNGQLSTSHKCNIYLLTNKRQAIESICCYEYNISIMPKKMYIMNRIVLANKQNATMLFFCFKTFYHKNKTWCLEYKPRFRAKIVTIFVCALITYCIDVKIVKTEYIIANTKPNYTFVPQQQNG